MEPDTLRVRKVEVALDGDRTRTFNIESPDAGHAFTVDMDKSQVWTRMANLREGE